MEPADEQLLGLMPQQLRDDLATVARMAAHGAGPDVTPELFEASLAAGALQFVHVALARYGHQSAPPVEGEVADLVAWMHDEADQYDCIQQAPQAACKLRRAADLLSQHHPAPVPERAANPWKDALIDALACAFLLTTENESDPKKALRDLVSWETRLAMDPSINPLMRPVPVSERLPGPEDCDGEVGELVAWLHGQDGGIERRAIYSRIADLLTRLALQPVPVSERLPKPKDCDAEGTCWAWHGTATSWGLFRLDPTVHSHWLPASVLPLPAGEVE